MSAMLPDLLLMTSFKMVKQLIAKTCALGVAPFTVFLTQYLIQLSTAILTRAILPTGEIFENFLKIFYFFGYLGIVKLTTIF